MASMPLINDWANVAAVRLRVPRHTGATGVGFWLVPMARGLVALLGDEKIRENSNFRKIEMANIDTEAVSTPDVTQ
jgi:hypothetical protein